MVRPMSQSYDSITSMEKLSLWDDLIYGWTKKIAEICTLPFYFHNQNRYETPWNSAFVFPFFFRFDAFVMSFLGNANWEKIYVNANN